MGRFAVIYGDPPWAYRDSGIRGAAEKHYGTLSRDDLARMPIAKLAADDCALFLWATWPTLPDAFALIEAWGFTYKTCAFDWVKTTKDGRNAAMGLGHWTRGNSEVVLLATRGRPVRIDKGVPQTILDETLEQEALFAPRGKHSAKPAEVRDRIVRLMGDVPRLELFARERPPGWVVWGNQVPTLPGLPAPNPSTGAVP